jgi:hypothetical protein
MSRPRPRRCVVALAVFAAAVSGANAGSAVAWLQGSDMRAEPSSAQMRRGGGDGAPSDELDDLRARIAPAPNTQADMRDLQDARDTEERAAVASTSENAAAHAQPPKQRQQQVESAGGGVDFAAGPPAADQEDIARRVRASHGEIILIHGGLGDGGDSTTHTAVLAGLGAGEGAVFCRLAEEEDATRGTAAFASSGAAVSVLHDKAYFHGGYKVWDGGNDFQDNDALAVFDGSGTGWVCAGAECGAGAGGGGAGANAAAVTPGRRDEHVAVVTPHPITFGGIQQRALVVFGGRDETDKRLDSVFAFGLDDGAWHEVDTEKPKLKKNAAAVSQGPFDLPLVIKESHKGGSPFPLARSAASAVVTDENVMFFFGGFVVEGRLGFNVGELLALDLNTFKFFYPKVTGDLPVRRNKHTAVLDANQQMWVWGGSVWDHTGGSATYASTATHVADLSNPRHVVWRRVHTKGLPPSQRRLHASVIKDGVMYVIGGEDYHSKQFLQDVHALDLKSRTWSQPATAGSAGGGRIRAAAVGLTLRDKGLRALVRCGEGVSAPAVTGELQPGNDKLVTALEESGDGMGKAHSKALFAAAMGGRWRGNAETAAIDAGWVPTQNRGSRLESGVSKKNKDLGDHGLLVESRGMWRLHLLAQVAGTGLMEIEFDDLPEFSPRGAAMSSSRRDADVETHQAAAASVPPETPENDVSVGADGWATVASRAGARGGFKTETKQVDARSDLKTAKKVRSTLKKVRSEKATKAKKSETARSDTVPAPVVARQGRSESGDTKSHKQVKAEVSRGASRMDADYESLDDFPRPEISTKQTKGETWTSSKASKASKSSKASSSKASSRTRLPGSQEAAAVAASEVRDAERVAARDRAAAKVGEPVVMTGKHITEPIDREPFDPRAVAASADNAYQEIAENDKREAAAAARNAVTRSSLGEGDDENLDDGDGNLSGSEIVVDATTLGGDEKVFDVEEAGDFDVASVLVEDAAAPESSYEPYEPYDAPAPSLRDDGETRLPAPNLMNTLPLSSLGDALGVPAVRDDRAASAVDDAARSDGDFGEGKFGPDEFQTFVRPEYVKESETAHAARVDAAARAKSETLGFLVEASLGERDPVVPANDDAFSFSFVGNTQSNLNRVPNSVFRVLSAAAVVATVGIFGIALLVTRGVGGTSNERQRLVAKSSADARHDSNREVTPLAPHRESPTATTATWQAAAAKRWQSHFANGHEETFSVRHQAGFSVTESDVYP